MDRTWLWSLIGVMAACLTSTSFIPQLIVRLRNPGQARLSNGTLFTFLVGAGLWTAYGVHLQDWIIIGANILIGATLVAIGMIQYWQEKGKG